MVVLLCNMMCIDKRKTSLRIIAMGFCVQIGDFLSKDTCDFFGHRT